MEDPFTKEWDKKIIVRILYISIILLNNLIEGNKTKAISIKIASVLQASQFLIFNSFGKQLGV